MNVLSDEWNQCEKLPSAGGRAVPIVVSGTILVEAAGLKPGPADRMALSERQCPRTGSSGWSSICLCWRCWRSIWASSIARSTWCSFARPSAGPCVWMGLAGCFAVLPVLLRTHPGRQTARPNSQLSLEFVTGYLIEQSLSVDNLFVFLLIFRYFQVPREVSARRAVLGSHRRAGDARHLHRCRHHAAEPLSLDHLHLRRNPDLQRHSSCSGSTARTCIRRTIRCCGCFASSFR